LAKLDADPVSPREHTSRGSGAATGRGPRFGLVHREELPGHHRWRAVLGEREPEQLAVADVAVAGPLDHSPSVTVLIVVGSVLDDHRGGARIGHGSDPFSLVIVSIKRGLLGRAAFRFVAPSLIRRVIEIPHFFFPFLFVFAVISGNDKISILLFELMTLLFHYSPIKTQIINIRVRFVQK